MEVNVQIFTIEYLRAHYNIFEFALLFMVRLLSGEYKIPEKQ